MSTEIQGKTANQRCLVKNGFTITGALISTLGNRDTLITHINLLRKLQLRLQC